MSISQAMRALASERRLQVLEWLKDPTAHFPPQVDGNPAAVCPLEAWLPDDVMQAIAAENNLSETAFFVAEDEGYRLRWFTPATEVDLCGHATLASAYVVFRWLSPQRHRVTFATQEA